MTRRRSSRTNKPGAKTAPVRAQYLRGDRSGILHMRRAVTRDGGVNVREAAERASALAWDFMQNSGWLAGAAQQIITDTIGNELQLSCRPDLARLGYPDAEKSAFCKLVEARWRQFAWSPEECDLAGKATIPEILDGVIRYYLAGGEAIGVLDYLPARQRALYGIKSGTKISLVAPHRLKRETHEFSGLDQGIFHDSNGRATHYRFLRREAGIETEADIPAWDGNGLRRVIHVMDRGENPDSVRGISPLAPIMKVAAQFDQLADATLATALMQTIFAATIKSPEPSVEAFEAISALEDDELKEDLYSVWSQRIDKLKEGGGISMNDPARINHLGPGEDFQMHTAQTPGSQYLPFSQNLQREMARALGVTFESLSMDHSNATYSSVRMGISSVWPIVVRRRERIAAPFCQAIYENWLDEMIFTGQIPFKGGYTAFAANRSAVTWTEWQGPSQPTADDYRSAMAARVRLESGLSSLADECALQGRNWEDVSQQRATEKALLLEQGLPIPFERMTGGAGPNGMAADGQREPAKVE
ncbi:phage portal protein [Pseudochelatococcus sp. G4_1912]|uniref:phage portal protein n=1 Tax=Pseudochelatococcus sp. G4_1912 TaxID=3114288 RepID=UPI0039C73965